jgi:hypothetical protein
VPRRGRSGPLAKDPARCNNQGLIF